MGEKKFAQMYILRHNVGRVHVAEGKQKTVLINELLQLNVSFLYRYLLQKKTNGTARKKILQKYSSNKILPVV
jgi:hypothetical protein